VTVPLTGTPNQGSIAQAARIWAENGFSVVPIRADGTKRPALKWQAHQNQIPGPIWLAHHFGQNPDHGIGIVCGAVSGNLEMTELEGRATTTEAIRLIGQRCTELGVRSTWILLVSGDGYMERSPSGGIHLLYRVVDHEVPGNTKLARRPATAEELADKPLDKVKVLAETRGEGGYVIVAPTGGTVHPSGGSWEVLAGRIGDVPEITWDQRNLIHEAIRDVLDEMPEPQGPANAPVPTNRAPSVATSANHGTRPGDDFNEKAEWLDILIPAGWSYSHIHGNTVYWVRPGKDVRQGHSATTGHAGTGTSDRLYVMSSATDLPTDEPLSKFYVYTHYNHMGNFAEATKALAAQGYGDQSVYKKVNIDYEPWDTGGGWMESNVDSPETKASPTATLARSKGVRDYTLTGACVRFLDKNRCCIRYVTEQKMWRVWDGTRWREDPGGARVSIAWEALTEEMDAEAQAMAAEGSEFAKAYTAHVKKLRNNGPSAALKIIQSHVTCSAKDFDADPRYLNLRNGIYDVVEMAFLPHDPKYMLTKMMGAAYNPQAKAPRAEKFLAELMPDFEQRDYVMRALGYTLTGEADQRAFFLLHGLPGTGKSQFIEMIKELFGDYGVTAMASTFHKRTAAEAATPGLHALRGARFITTSETSQETQLDDELIKRFTGKDVLTTRSLYETPQEWIPQGTIWFATNHLPKFASDEDAVWRRVKTLPFATQFSDDGSTGQRSEPNIGRKIVAEEADGLLGLLLAALAVYRAAGRLEEPSHVKQAVADHKRDVDPVAQFVADSIDAGELAEAPGQQTEFGPLYQAYCNYHKQEVGSYPLGRRRFADSLRSILGYDRLIKSNGKTYLPGWMKSGWVIGGHDIGRVHREVDQE
jgi:P4 family phage/plasmid primase-like protien